MSSFASPCPRLIPPIESERRGDSGYGLGRDILWADSRIPLTSLLSVFFLGGGAGASSCSESGSSAGCLFRFLWDAVSASASLPFPIAWPGVPVECEKIGKAVVRGGIYFERIYEYL